MKSYWTLDILFVHNQEVSREFFCWILLKVHISRKDWQFLFFNIHPVSMHAEGNDKLILIYFLSPCLMNERKTKAWIILLIHSADPKSRPVGIIVFTHVVRPSVSTFQNLAKQNKYQAKTMFTTGETLVLAEWITDYTCIVLGFVSKCFSSWK